MLNVLVEELGRRMQIPELSLDEQGILCLDIDNIGTLQLEYDAESDTLFLCLARTFAVHEQDMAQKVLELCSYSQNPSMPLHGGISENMVVLVNKVAYNKTTAQELENIIRELASKLELLFNPY